VAAFLAGVARVSPLWPPSGAAWPRIEAAYVHLDRFMLLGTVGCDETVLGHAVPLPDPATQTRLLSFP
jgi:hypothetical protein